MEGGNIEDDRDIFTDICLDSDTDVDSDDFYDMWQGKLPPQPPRSDEVFVDFEKYVQEKCENKIKLLDRSTFHQIQRPTVICFNHFREKCAHLTRYLDRIYQLTLKYGDRIEIIAADRIDIDILHPHSNPIQFFCNLVRPENESLKAYAIDERKRIHEHFDAEQTVETLSELCDNLLSGHIFKSQPIPETNETFVKLCVHLNFDELVTNSSKDILLVVGLGEYQICEEREPNYEEIAKNFLESNLDVVYINANKNYVPFELNVWCYPTIIFIPHNNKKNFVTFSKGPRDTKNLQEYIKSNIGSQGHNLRLKELSQLRYQQFCLPENDVLLFNDLEQYMDDNYPNSFKLLDRNAFGNMKQCAIICFFDFQAKGVTFYLKWLREIHQVAATNSFYNVEFLIADLKDMDVMLPEWFCKDILGKKESEKGNPEVFAIDGLKRKYRVMKSHSAALLFYYSFDLARSGQYYSQPVTEINIRQPVITCVAANLQSLILKCKKKIFLTIYWSTYESSFNILTILDEIAPDAKKMGVKMIKMDAKVNYVPLEYSYPTYPVHFFIPRYDKDLRTIRYSSSNLSKEDILEFIRKHSTLPQVV